ncbi:MAG: DUF1800 family protein [Spirosomataceae bacterium]
MNQREVQHLFWRAGFGESLAVIKAFEGKSAKKVFAALKKDSEKFRRIDIVSWGEVMAELKQLKDLSDKNDPNANKERQKKLVQDRKEEHATLNTTWVDLMVGGGAFREKMALFWHGVLVARSINPAFSQSYLNTIRENALGKFGDLLMAVSKEPAMLQFLNNQQNRKRSPNENFAREVMELFTLGRGNYSEKDIKEAARAFTGWSFRPLKAEFEFREEWHDDGEKTIFGKTGNFKGEDVIELILSKRQTAKFITTKIYKFFINDTPNQEIINDLAKRFYESEYDISQLMEHIFTSNWFYDEQNIGSKIKSPIELLVGIQRGLGVRFEEKQPLLFTQKVLGQVLLFPPNVAGWASGQSWIDSSSLLFRMELPLMILKNSTINVAAKDDGDVGTTFMNKRGRTFAAEVDWDSYIKKLKADKPNELVQEASQYLLQIPVNQTFLKGFENKIKTEDREEAIKQATLGLMMLPEYQLC